MEASKITFSRETRAKLNSPVLDRKKKKKLKVERIKEYIRSKPTGTRFHMADLIYAAGYDAKDPGKYASGYAFVKGLHKKRIINIEKTDKYKKIITIPSDAKATKSVVAKTLEQLPQPETNNDQVDSAAYSYVSKIEERATKWSWNNPERNNDLRAFISSLKEK